MTRLLLAYGLVLAACRPEAVPAAGEEKVWKVGLLHVGLDHVPASVDGLREGLRARGYEEPGNIRLDWRNVADEDAARTAADEFVKDGADAIVAFGNPAVRAARAATATIPILFVHAVDPIASGFIKRAFRPDRNLTGFAGTEWETPARQMAVFKELVPKLRKLLVLADPADPSTPGRLEEARKAAPALKLQLVERAIKNQAGVERAFGLVKAGNTDGVLVVSPDLQQAFDASILRLAAQKRLPLMGRRAWVAQGALFFYGPDVPAVGLAAARYLHRLLRGTAVENLFVEFSQSELVINLKTAKALGLPVPNALIARAGLVIR